METWTQSYFALDARLNDQWKETVQLNDRQKEADQRIAESSSKRLNAKLSNQSHSSSALRRRKLRTQFWRIVFISKQCI